MGRICLTCTVTSVFLCMLIYIIIHREPKKWDTLFVPINLINVDQFSNSFTFRLSSDCEINWSLNLKEMCTVIVTAHWYVAGVQPVCGWRCRHVGVVGQRCSSCRCVHCWQTQPRSVIAGWRWRACVFNGGCDSAAAVTVCHCIWHTVDRFDTLLLVCISCTGCICLQYFDKNGILVECHEGLLACNKGCSSRP